MKYFAAGEKTNLVQNIHPGIRMTTSIKLVDSPLPSRGVALWGNGKSTLLYTIFFRAMDIF